jgi:hypothetical protein
MKNYIAHIHYAKYLLPEEKLQHMITQIGDDEESIRKYLQEKLIQTQNTRQEKHAPINKMFEYGISGSCIHLHMPVDLHEMMSQKGLKKTFDTVNLYLLDAIERIRKLQSDGFHRFNGKDSIYMISPILVEREMKFLEDLDLETHAYKKKELQSEKFVAEHPEAQLAVHIFGKNNNVGTAKIDCDNSCKACGAFGVSFKLPMLLKLNNNKNNSEILNELRSLNIDNKKKIVIVILDLGTKN